MDKEPHRIINAVDYYCIVQALLVLLYQMYVSAVPGRRSLLLSAPLFRSNILLVFPSARQANILLSILHMYLFVSSCYACCSQQAARSMQWTIITIARGRSVKS